MPPEDYEKTFMYRFRRWLNGTKDPFIDNIELKDQEIKTESEEEKEIRLAEKEKARQSAYDAKNNPITKGFDKAYNIFSILFCLLLVWLLATGAADLPDFGDKSNPTNNEVSERYLEKGLEETGAVNAVTGMILDYRAFDTLGESHVLFIATCAVLILLRVDDDEEKKKRLKEDFIHEPHNDDILKTVARVLTPPIFLFGLYIILAGHLGPGGGFAGGAVAGAGLILYLNAFGFEKTEKFFTAKTYKIMCFCALACYSFAKMYSFFTGANGYESVIGLGTPGAIISSGLIFVLNICVGVVVTGTMYTFYVMFRKGGY